MLRLAVALSLALPTVANAATYTVCASGCDYATITLGVTGAAAGDVLQVQAGTYTETPITISKNLTITGVGSGSVTVTNATGTLFTISSSKTVNISGMTLDPSTTATRAIEVGSGSTLNLSGVTVTGLSGSSSGLGAYVSGRLTATDSTFSTLDSSSDGGAIYVNGSSATLVLSNVDFTSCQGLDGGAIYLNSGSISATGGTFSANWADDDGGAVYAKTTTTATFDGTTFDANESSDQAGAIYQEGADVTYTSCTLSNNVADYSGGAVYAYQGDMVVEASTFSYNTCSADTAVSAGGGGDIRINDGDLEVTSSTFEGGSCDFGGSIYSSVNWPAVTITDSEFLASTGNTSGGQVYVLYGTLNVSGSDFTGGTASNFGGSIVSYGSTTSISDASFTSNATTSTVSGDAGGGAIALYYPSTTTITDSTFTSNSTAENGGAIWSYLPATTNITDNTFTGNSAVDGGAWYAYSHTSSSATSGYRNYFCSNTASSDGGAVFFEELDDSSATHRLASNFFVENTGTSTAGGLYALYSTNLDVRNNHILTNASAAGGGAYAGGIEFWNNLVGYTPSGNGFSAQSASASLTYNGWYSNTSSNVSGSITSLDSTNVTGTDPSLFDYTPGDGCGGDFRIRYESVMRDEGTGTDSDGTAADIGAYGGAYADSDWWDDADSDGFPWVYDCDEADATTYPTATEVCDGVDNDCDDTVDDGASGTWYADTDGDGYGEASTATTACPAPTGYVADGTDCDDGDLTAFPGATEVCDGVDDDCDGTIDDGVTTTYYADTDGDGFGDASATTQACSKPPGYVVNATDCDDGDSSAYPGASETCDGVDDDCDGTIDEGVTTTYYADGDSDGYGDASSTVAACSAPSGYVTSSTDCDDSDATAYPGASEYCDGADDDCDGTADDNAVDASTFYADADSDGYGKLSKTTSACSAPTGYVADSTDCDDADATAYPGATEYCDGDDDDCDGTADDGAVDRSTYYEDADGDGFGDLGSTTLSCSTPTGYTSDATDCDDAAAAVYPGAPEYCNSIDDDCDGTVDDDVVTYTFYADADGDGLGDPSVTTVDCTVPSGYVANDDDCDDMDPAVGEPSAWYADLDKDGVGDPGSETFACDAPLGFVAVGEDCDDTDAAVGAPATWYEDADDDGFGDATESVEACEAPTGHVADGSDCDDADAAIGGGLDWYADADEDGFGDPESGVYACEAPPGHVADGTDCDDTDATIAGAVTWYGDADGDGDGDAQRTELACEAPDGFVTTGTDCDDGDPDSYFGARELCDSVDNDCDGAVDDDVQDWAWYPDSDEDGFGDDEGSVVDCAHPVGTIAEGGDCDDGDASVNPDAEEIVGDGIDQDCDGEDASGAWPETSSRDWQPNPGQDPVAPGGCGCAVNGAPATGALLPLLGLLALRRRRR